MTEFKTISRAANRLDLRLALASGAVAFLVYLLTISPGVYPGQSAMLMATYTGIEPQIAPTHPLWAPIVGWLGGLLERWSGLQFWLLHAGLVGTAGVLMFIAARLAGHLLNPSSTDPAID